MDKKMMNAVIELLESGDDEGCDGLIVVDIHKFVALQQLVKDATGIEYGSVYQELSEEE